MRKLLVTAAIVAVAIPAMAQQPSPPRTAMQIRLP
jgi:hypothetical protein